MTRALTNNDVDHSSYIQDNAAIPAPQLLPMLVKVLEARGQQVLSPADRQGLHPLIVPLSRTVGGSTLTGVLRWPTSAGGDDMPIVEAGPHGLSLLANSCSEYIHRALVEEDLAVGADGPVRAAAGLEASTLYAAGSVSKDQRLEVYLVQKVGKFPDVMEGLARGHLAKGNTEANITSALVTAEWMTGNMPGWGRAPAFHSMLLSELGRHDESRDQARVALCSPWWTLGASYARVVDLAGYADKEPAWVRSALQGETTMKDAQLKGNAPQQQQKTDEEVAMEEAEALLDMAAVSGDWDAIRGPLVSKYMTAGLNKLAFFVQAVGAAR